MQGCENSFDVSTDIQKLIADQEVLEEKSESVEAGGVLSCPTDPGPGQHPPNRPSQSTQGELPEMECTTLGWVYLSTHFLPRDYGAYIALFYSNFNRGFKALFTGHIHHIYSFRATTKCTLINVSRAIWGSVSCLRTIWQDHINIMPGHIITRR